MKSDTLAQLLASLGASRSFSRPRISNDNAFSEAGFKTLKYQPDYPDRFDSQLHARGYLQDFFGWHNDEHHHSGLALFTPADVFHGRVDQVRAVRQAALDGAYQAHPERFPNGPPSVPIPRTVVHINPLHSEALSIADGAQDDVSAADLADTLDDATRHGPHAAHDSPGADSPATTASRQVANGHAREEPTVDPADSRRRTTVAT